jgi:hypothetical protein
MSEDINLDAERNSHWITVEVNGVMTGIKCFPRVGSFTILKTFGRRQSMDDWKKCKNRVVVVRNPWDRVLSVYYGMFRDKSKDWRMNDRGYPTPSSLTDFVEFLVRTPMEDLDIHTRSMHSQLYGYKPKNKELMLIERFIENLPHGLETFLQWKKKLWEHKSDLPEEIDHVSPELFAEWGEKWKEDLALYERAEKQAL